VTVNIPEEEYLAEEEKRLTITDPDNTPVVFVSDLAAAGYLNGVVNLTFVTANWTPRDGESKEVDVDLKITSRLRMDMYCAQRLWDQLDRFLKTSAAPSGGPSN